MATGFSSMHLGSDDCDLDCDICKFQNIKSPAVSYCNVCTEALCLACDKVHRAAKLTRNHKLLTGDQLLIISSGSLRTPAFMICDQHQLKITHFCKDHDDVFCSTCKITYHRTCEITEIASHTAGARPAQTIEKVQGRLTELDDKCTRWKANRTVDQSILKAKIQTCLDEVDKLRKQVNETMDNLEKNMKSEINAIGKTLEQEIDDHLTIADDTSSQIRENMKVLKECEKTDQTDIIFVGTKKVEKSILDYEKITGQIEEVQIFDLDFQPDAIFTVYMGQLKAMGTVQRHMDHPKDNYYLNMSIRDWNRYNVGSKKVQSIVFLPDDQVVLACAEYGLKLLDTNFQIKSELPMRAKRACLVSSTEVLVSLGRQAKLQFVQVKPTMAIRYTIDMGRHCTGIDFYNDEIYVACHGNPGNGEVRVLDRSGRVQRRLGTHCSLTIPSDIKVTNTGDKIIIVDRGNDSVTCLDQRGHVVFRYRDVDLKRPRSFLVDKDDNLLVCGEDSSNVHAISKEGKKQGILLTSLNGLSKPMCISYRQSDGCLAVGMEHKYPLLTFVIKT